MDRNDWGIKRICLGCSTRFYDFNKSPIVCPLCNAVFDPDYLSKRKTKNFQEKTDDVIGDIGVVVDSDDLIDEHVEDLGDDGDDIELDNEKN
ncbi:MAG: FYDLN acid domain-containing protein [Holosporaceae bacterium]|nr:FYDLN acid domain-containing protein [Holosporaceae bacterium]